MKDINREDDLDLQRSLKTIINSIYFKCLVLIFFSSILLTMLSSNFHFQYVIRFTDMFNNMVLIFYFWYSHSFELLLSIYYEYVLEFSQNSQKTFRKKQRSRVNKTYNKNNFLSLKQNIHVFKKSHEPRILVY